MKMVARKVRTDNGPLDSHVEYEIPDRPDLGVSAYWFGEKGGELFCKYAPFRKCKFSCAETLGEPLFNRLERPEGSAFPYPGIHNPGSGHASGPELEIEIFPEAEI